MAGVERAKKALWALLRDFDAGRTAKLTVSTVRGKLRVILEESFDQHSNVSPSSKAPGRVSPSQLALNLPTCQLALNSLKTSPAKDDIREEVLDGAVEKPPQVQVPHDFADCANNDYFHDFEKVREAEKILRETDRCCFCDFICPQPSKQENNDRESSFGILQSLWDQIT